MTLETELKYLFKRKYLYNMNWTYNDMFLTFSMYWLWKHWKVAVSNRKYTITLDELHFTSDLSDSNQPGTFKLTNHSWKFNAPSFLLTFPVQSGCCNEKSPVCGLSCFLLTVGGGGGQGEKVANVPRSYRGGSCRTVASTSLFKTR